jgi:hypothetical protein
MRNHLRLTVALLLVMVTIAYDTRGEVRHFRRSP